MTFIELAVKLAPAVHDAKSLAPKTAELNSDRRERRRIPPGVKRDQSS